MLLSCGRGCGCARADSPVRVANAQGISDLPRLLGGGRSPGASRDSRAAPTPSRAEACGDAEVPGGHDVRASAGLLPGPPEELQKGTIVRGSPEKAAFVPLEEDCLMFELETRRSAVAREHLTSFRRTVEQELLALECKEGPPLDAEQQFCSDATLLRYLGTTDGNERKSLDMLRETLKWRKAYLGLGPSATQTTLECTKCLADPRSHCFLKLGEDAVGRSVIYSCAGRAGSKGVADCMWHMACELERIFDGNAAPGQVTWIADFAGFGIADCNPRMGAEAGPMFANHYPERLGQIVLLGLPTFFRAAYSTILPFFDKATQRRIVVLRTPEARRRYAERYWHCNPAMAAWIEAVCSCRAYPGGYPDLGLSRSLCEPQACELLERCAQAAAMPKF